MRRLSRLLKKLRAFVFRRSNGIRVSWRISGLIREADAARDRGDWPAAIRLFETVLAARPMLNHVQVQYGHALKENGRPFDAYTAYQQAAALAPNRRDPRLHLGHAAKMLGRASEAAGHYLELVMKDWADAEAVGEFARTLSQMERTDRDNLLRRLRDHLPEELVDLRRGGSPLPGPVLVFDLSDLLGFFAQARRPTGIQRVQIEVVAAAMSATPSAGLRTTIACMPYGFDEWRELPASVFEEIVRLSRVADSNDGLWRQTYSRMNLAVLLTPPMTFHDRSSLVNLGASWSLGNYFLALRNVSARRIVCFLPFVHDLIPIVHPEYHSPALIDEFRCWLGNALAASDRFLTNSEATRADLTLVSDQLGLGALRQPVSVVHLNADTAMSSAEHRAGRIPTEPFILFVGTIEPRKGHAAAFNAWSILLRSGRPIPRLICVSGRGWGNEAILARLTNDPLLAAAVEIRSGVDDAELDQLYRHAVFTIYPSRYEGWGLPVSEALARGKVVVTTTASSLPEAGGSLAYYVPPDDAVALATMIDDLVARPEIRIAREHRIVREYRTRTWEEVAAQIVEIAAATVAGSALRSAAPRLEANRYYHLGTGTLPSDAGEAFRSGNGWFWPETWGNRIRDEGATLLFSIPESRPTALCRPVVAILLRGAAGRSCRYRVTTDDGVVRRGQLHADQRRWVFFRPARTSTGEERVTIAHETDMTAASPSDRVTGRDQAIGIEGLILLPSGSRSRTARRNAITSNGRAGGSCELRPLT